MKIAICDSSSLFLNGFVKETKKFVPTSDIVCFRRYNDLLNSDNLTQYDCFFIATEINCQSGVEVALEINSRNSEAEIVFVTENCEKYSQQIFYYADTFRPLALLCKPASKLILGHILEMMQRIAEHRKSRDIVIRLEDKDYISVNTSEIMYVQHKNRISYIYTFNGDCYSSKYSISWFEENLPNCFLHCAKSCIVNSMNIKLVNGLEIILSDGNSIWCSRQYKKSFIESLEQCCS